MLPNYGGPWVSRHKQKPGFPGATKKLSPHEQKPQGTKFFYSRESSNSKILDQCRAVWGIRLIV